MLVRAHGSAALPALQHLCVDVSNSLAVDVTAVYGLLSSYSAQLLSLHVHAVLSSLQLLWELLLSGVLACTQLRTLSLLCDMDGWPLQRTPCLTPSPAMLPTSPISPHRRGMIDSCW